jgi:hypothetical protein
MADEIRNVDEEALKNRKTYNKKAILWIVVMVVGFVLTFIVIQEEWAAKIYTVLFFVVLWIASSAFVDSNLKARESFMLQIARSHNLAYTASGSSKDMRAHIFKYQGEGGISHVLWGMYADNPITVFLYQYSTGGDPPRIFSYTVCQIQYKGKVPNIMMTNLKHSKPPFFDRMYRKGLVLGNEFDKHFSIFVPEDFQIEALEILTPDIAHTILAEGSTYSFEFVDHYLFLYVPGHMRSAQEFDAFIGFGKYLSETLGPRLERLSRDVGAMHEVYAKPRA